MKKLTNITTAIAFTIAITAAYGASFLLLATEGVISTPMGPMCVAGTVPDNCNLSSGTICTFSTSYQGVVYNGIQARIPVAGLPCTGAFRRRTP